MWCSVGHKFHGKVNLPCDLVEVVLSNFDTHSPTILYYTVKFI